MYKRILLALDLEGVNHVVGEPYMSLSKGSEHWEIAVKQAILEVNTAADALFRAGADKVGLWDNHGGGGNVPPEELDKRITFIKPDKTAPYLSFARDGYDCICYFGYHAMEGTLGGVLAHTMNSKVVQYYKLNGKHIGEIDMNAYVFSSYGLPSCFFSGGDIACKQASRALPGIVTVETKKEISRNKAVFRHNEELFEEIGEKIVTAVDVSPPYDASLFSPRCILLSHFMTFASCQDRRAMKNAFDCKLKKCAVYDIILIQDEIGRNQYV